MEVRYDILLENIKKLPLSEKEELKNLIEKYIIEEKREKIYENYLKSLNEYKENRLQFSSDINELRKNMELE
ncbi:hypothetical protein [Thermosulfurimonas sp. F29]|uniref:hypothetical protein n=1 Tax=Thermosulfurimonas sp. F29 TaxID=2867247 RepID=UPI001C82CA0C|nr:hypothetical protein [Thermosulfurimonas sp. F29]MBX6422005.1 hypothetical protein [Thermosulfurimonas sp. F29]